MKWSTVIGLGIVVGVAGALMVPQQWLIAETDSATRSGEIWACPMLCVKLSAPGDCPVCGMTLEKLETGGKQLHMTEDQGRMIGLRTAIIESRLLQRRIRTVGQLDYNERRVRTISAWVAGRIDRLYADHTYAEVRADDHVMLLYSPELYAAQQELLAGGSLRASARRKLELLGMRSSQIDAVATSGKARESIEIRSPISGRVIDLKVREGQYVKVGTPLYTVADFGSFWLRFHAYEEDLPWVAVGQRVEVSLDARPGQVFEGTVSFIEGIVDTNTRTTQVRVTVDNPGGVLKPGMAANVTIVAGLGTDGGAVRPPLKGRYGCYMHPSVHADRPGECPICDMALELRPTHEGSEAQAPVLAVPRAAVLSTGERHLVYLQAKHGAGGDRAFELREVQIGHRAGEYFQVLSGLEAGDVVATDGAMLIDSQMQLTGRPSLFSVGDSAAPADPHAGH
ncbi:MAG: Cu(I)/Ag(I) efflux system membrane fusion protein [Myxococcota bacterium]|jgi:Cu(I)/Ag(I) efflux system membrane fusion protein